MTPSGALSEIKSKMESRKASGIIIKNPSNIYYLTGYTGEGFAFVPSYEGQIVLFVDGRYIERARKEAREGVDIVGVKETYKEIASDILKRLSHEGSPPSPNPGRGRKAVIFESNFFSYEEYRGFKNYFNNMVKFIPSDGLLSKIRVIKNKDELSYIKKAVSIAEESLIASLKEFLDNAVSGKGRAEKDVVSIYRKLLIDKGSSESFDTIVLSGPNSSMPHGTPSSSEIDPDEILLCDFGAQWNHYKSDETITLHLGNPDKKFLDVYGTVYSAQQLAISNAKPGAKFKDLDRMTRDYMKTKGYEKYFTHSLGHGVGLDIHEYPFVYAKNEEILEEGMVFTIEPGIYIEGEFGVRLEDMVYVNASGAEVITTIDKKSHKTPF